MTSSTIRPPVLVTGATGLIGERLVHTLVERGVATRALVLPQDSIARLPEAVEVLRGDISVEQDVRRACEGVGTIFHLAAVVGDWGEESWYQQVTVEGTRYVLDGALAAGARVVLTSSIVTYGDRLGRDICTEEHSHGKPMGPYGRSKQAQERMARERAEEKGLELVVVRPGNVYGPRSRNWVDEVLVVLAAGTPALIDGGGQNAGLIYVDNLVELMCLAAAHPQAAGNIYNALDGGEITWRQYFGDLARLAALPAPRSAPRFAAAILASSYELLWRLLRRSRRPPLTREALNLIGSHHRVPIAKARAELGYEPPVSYEQGLERIADYLREIGQRGAG